MTRKRILLGAVVMAALSVLLGELISLSGLYGVTGPTGHSVIVMLLAAAAGAFVARRGFLFPAFVVTLAIWAANIYVLYQIAAPTGQASVVSILQYNLLAFALSVAAVTSGVLLGQWLAGRSTPATSAAT